MVCPDATIVRWHPRIGPPRRHRYEPTKSGYERIEERWNGCTWVRVGSEPVADVVVENNS